MPNAGVVSNARSRLTGDHKKPIVGTTKRTAFINGFGIDNSVRSRPFLNTPVIVGRSGAAIRGPRRAGFRHHHFGQ